jgi:hypothetical protein
VAEPGLYVNVLVTSKRSLNRSVIRAPNRKPIFWLTRKVPSRRENFVGIEMLAMGLTVTIWAWSGAAAREIAAAPSRRTRVRALV